MKVEGKQRKTRKVTTMFSWISDRILNKLAVWCINHCYNDATIFYTACKQLDNFELSTMTELVLLEREKIKKK